MLSNAYVFEADLLISNPQIIKNIIIPPIFWQ